MYHVLIVDQENRMTGLVYQTKEKAREAARTLSKPYEKMNVYIYYTPGDNMLSRFENEEGGPKAIGKPWRYEEE